MATMMTMTTATTQTYMEPISPKVGIPQLRGTMRFLNGLPWTPQQGLFKLRGQENQVGRDYATAVALWNMYCDSATLCAQLVDSA
ncbi:hypothetical protein PV08_10037 [Exophiala spinifera]|uniref:Uncharacterized protein n=1 Tax=Exophiala spinifera TaxID=91928 RepID=A0A0D2AVI0_9EURO|nr:uncharacterized protein PV08_10037 [Exophiala spinifera]KIW10738.1 hypothetical protein PV08_10037 [Exophiala spinifera]